MKKFFISSIENQYSGLIYRGGDTIIKKRGTAIKKRSMAIKRKGTAIKKMGIAIKKGGMCSHFFELFQKQEVDK